MTYNVSSGTLSLYTTTTTHNVTLLRFELFRFVYRYEYSNKYIIQPCDLNQILSTVQL